MSMCPCDERKQRVLALLFGLAVVAPVPTFAMESTPNTVASPPSTSVTGPGLDETKKDQVVGGQKQQRSDREFSDGFWVAYNLIYKDHDYAAASPSCTALATTMMPPSPI